jgi:hypothetical protein
MVRAMANRMNSAGVLFAALSRAGLALLLAGCPSDRKASPSTASSAKITLPNVPDSLRAPAGETVTAKAAAQGVQIYECQKAADTVAWKLTAPEAELTDDAGKPAGRHYAGPTWEAADGSKVVGEVKARVDSPSPDAVQWLLLKAKSNEGQGTFGKVTSIQRVNTVGGRPPVTGCDLKSLGTSVRIPYQATYYFYTTNSN